VPIDVPPIEVFERWFDPIERTPLLLGLAYGKDYLNASSFFTANFDSRASIGDQFTIGDEFTNGTMVGASPEQLEAWGYDPIELPNIDDRIDRCQAEPESSQVQSWAALDQYMMESVLAWIPYVFELHTRTTSTRVAEFSWDQFMAQPALDRIALEPEE